MIACRTRAIRTAADWMDRNPIKSLPQWNSSGGLSMRRSCSRSRRPTKQAPSTAGRRRDLARSQASRRTPPPTNDCVFSFNAAYATTITVPHHAFVFEINRRQSKRPTISGSVNVIVTLMEPERSSVAGGIGNVSRFGVAERPWPSSLPRLADAGVRSELHWVDQIDLDAAGCGRRVHHKASEQRKGRELLSDSAACPVLRPGRGKRPAVINQPRQLVAPRLKPHSEPLLLGSMCT